jgi:hypothetical protein
MRHCKLLALLLVSLGAFAQAPTGTFVPQSPLTPKEAADQKAMLKKNTRIPDADIDELLKKDHSYRESDIVAAFPELRGGKKLTSCSNSMMSGATQIVFMSDVGKNEVTIKTIECTPVKNGLSCGAVRSEKNYFLFSAEHHFALENLTLITARNIIEAYAYSRIEGLPDWLVPMRLGVRVIKAQPHGLYSMYFGDYFCAGCGAHFDVRLDTGGNRARLIFVGNADLDCI